jgi:hypothetical protein
MVAKQLGLEDQSEDAIASALAVGDPNTFLELKKAEIEFQRFLKEADIRLYEADVQDRSSARELAKVVGIVPQVLLSIVYSVGYFWLLAELLSGHIQVAEDVRGLVNTLMGVMTAAQIQIMNFWFGSSAGSKAKTDAQLAPATGRG